MGERKHVVVTGAAGRMVGLILPALRERYDLTLLDRRKTTREGVEIADIQVEDLLDRDRAALRRHFQDAYAVVHGGFVGNADRTQAFWDELANVEMAYNVYQAAWEANARRVVVMSSNHAADYYERLILDGKMDVVNPEMRALSDNYYGWAKETYEHLGFVFAVGQVNGRPLENVQIRIGAPRETDGDRCAPGDWRCLRRYLGAYMSQRDMQQLFIKAIEAEDIRDERGVPFQIFYGISGNHHAFWSIANAREMIGYAPEDNSEIRFHELIARHVRAAREKDE